MTEPTDKTTPTPLLRHERYAVDPVAFVAALFGAPVVVTVFSFWTVAGLFALPVGTIPYLLIGTPVLLWAVGRVRPRFATYALLGFAANLAGFALCGMLIALEHQAIPLAEMLIMIFGFGMIFGTLWAGAFGSLYARFHRGFRILKT